MFNRAAEAVSGPRTSTVLNSSMAVTWTPLRNMGHAVNTEAGENCPILSPCGKYFFFTSRKAESVAPSPTYDSIKARWTEPENGQRDVYWIDARIIEKFRQFREEPQ